MDSKIIAIIAVAVVVVAGGAAAFIALSGGNEDHYDDFAMLADEKNFTKGFTYSLDRTLDGKSIESFKVTVIDREVNLIDYTLDYRNWRTETSFTKSDFLVAFEFSVDDAVADLPEGITVSKADNTYTITGTEYVTAYHGFRCKVDFYDVRLTADGTNFTAGYGSVKFVSEDTSKQGTLNISYAFSTIEGSCNADIVLEESETEFCSVEDLFSSPILPNSLYVKDCIVTPVKTGETKKIGNVDCDVYTYTIIDETHTISVYEGIILLNETTGKHVDTVHVDKK